MGVEDESGPEVMLKIGDIVAIKRSFDYSNESTTVALKCEGFMDALMGAQLCSGWLGELELCLFKVEVPMSVATKSTKLEEKAIKTANLAAQGTVVKYGQQVQLRHLHSGGHLSLALCSAAQEPGTFSIVVSHTRKNTLNIVTLQPDSKLQKIGEPIRYWDRVEILFQEGNLKHYLHLRQPRHSQDYMAVVGSLQASAWSFFCFEDVNNGDACFKCGRLVQVQLMNSVLHLSEKGEQALLRGDKDDYDGYWIAERDLNTVGGSLHFGEIFYLKNAKSGLYLSSDLKLHPEPQPHSSLYLPKPESFKTYAEVSYSFPVLVTFELGGGKLASAVTERKEEIMSEIVPHSGSQSNDSLILEAALTIDMTQGKDVLFHLDQMDQLDADFLMQMAKLVPRLADFQAKLEAALEAGQELVGEAKLVEGVLKRASYAIGKENNPDVYERRQSIVCGIGVHQALISIAYAVSKAKCPCAQLQHMVRSIWTFLIEVVANNEYASRQVELQKDRLIAMVATEKQLIGRLLTEVYRLVDPEMPNYVQDFKDWCDKLETPREDNVLEQTVFLKLIKCLCEVGDNVKVEYQKAIIDHLYGLQPFPLVKLLKQNGVFVQFYSRQPDMSFAEFTALNPSLPFEESLSHIGPCVSVEELGKLPGYVEYVANALLLLQALCKGKLEAGKELARAQGLTSEIVTELLQEMQLHLNLREALLLVADSLFVSCPPYQSTLQRKKENFCYVMSELLARRASISASPMDSGRLQTPEVHLCLHLTLSLWMQRELPTYLKGVQKLHVLTYLTACLRVAHSLLDFDHCSSMYASCLSRGLAFLLQGLRSGKEEHRRHWASAVVQVTAKDQQHTMELRVQLHELFRVLVQLLTAVACVTRQSKLTKLASACCLINFDDLLSSESPELTELIDGVNDPLEGLPSLKRLMGGMNSFSQEDERLELTPQPRMRLSQEVLLKGPDTQEALFRLLLSWESIDGGLKDAVIVYLRQSYDRKSTLVKYLRCVDVLAEPRLQALYDELRTYSEQHPLALIAQDCKFEVRQGKCEALTQLCDAVRHISNFVSPRTGHPAYIVEKLQNVLRHLSLHKQVMSLWPLVLYIGRLPLSAELDRELLRLTTLMVCFLLNFCRRNSRNRAELLILFESNYYHLKVPQYAELIREMTDFEELNPDNSQRLITFLLDNVDSAHSSAFLSIVMYRRNGEPREDLQNLVARLVAARVAKTQEPELLLTLASAAHSNSHAVVLCRALKSLDQLAEAAKGASPAMVEALLAYLYFVHLRAYSRAEACARDTLAFVPILQSALLSLQPVLSGQLLLVESAKQGLVKQVFPIANSSIVEEMRALEPRNDTRLRFHLLSCLTDLLPQLLPALSDRTHLALPVVKETQSQLQSLQAVVKTQQNQYEYLDYTLMLASLDASLKACSSFISKLEAKEEPRTLNFIARALAQTVRHSKKEEDVSFNNYNLDERLNKMAILYISKSALDEEGYLDELAKVFRSAVFVGEMPAKLPRETSDTLVKMLIRLQRVFADTHHRAFYFNFLKRLVPAINSPADRRRKYMFNSVFTKAGVVEEAVLATTSSATLAEANAALTYLNELMQEQSKDFQDEFMALLDAGEKSYYLFARVKTELEHVKAKILEQTSKSARRSLFRTLDKAPEEEHLVTELIEEGLSGREIFVINALVLLQLCCDNCNVDFQDYIRRQRKQAGLANVDLISEVATFVIDLTSAGEYVKESRLPNKMLVKSLAAMLDFVTGPCPGNQVALGNHVPLFLAINKMLEFTSFEISKPANKIHEKVIIFIHTLLEGRADPSITQTMVNFLDIKMMREGVEQFYEEHIRGQDEDFQLELTTLNPLVTGKLHSMLLQAIFLLKLKRMHRGHPELKKFGSKGLEEKDAYNFFMQYIGYVELDRAGVVESHYFPIPFKCKYLTFSSRQWLLLEVNRQSHQKKIEDFMGHVGIFMREMQHQQLLSRSRSSKALISRWKFFAQLSFLVVLLINVQLLFTFETSVDESFHKHPINRTVIQSMNILELLLYMVSFIFNMLEYFPNKIAPQALILGAEIDRYHQFPHNESQYLRLLYQDLGSEKVQRESFEAQIKEIFSNLDFYYNYVYFLTAVVAIYYPLVCPVLLLDLVKQNTELVNVLKAVTVNLRQLVITLILGMIIIFLFSVYAFVSFQDYFDESDGLFCNDVLHCFSSILHVGVRGDGGIGDRLLHPDYDGPDYWTRMIFDMLFFLVVIIVLLSIIFGIIIDTFAQLRNQRSSVLEDIHTRCYVCASERNEIELRGKGWAYHFMVEHSPLAYLAFLVYLLEMPTVDCSGIEKYAKEKFEKRDYTFMPATSKMLQSSYRTSQ